jgi:DNA repair photolyase
MRMMVSLQAAQTLDVRRRGTSFVELPVRSIINPPESTGMGFWSINPYMGCEFGCTYCYARFAHRYAVERSGTTVDLASMSPPAAFEPFEHRILVKSRTKVSAALEHDLRRVRRRRERDGTPNLVIGTATDPYQPAERQYQITRSVLARLCGERGFRIGIITKSALVTRDRDLLSRLAQRHLVSVYVSLISVDEHITNHFEARSPTPQVRLRTLRRLADASIRVGLLAAPILPGITDTVPHVRALVRAGRDAGAQFVFPSSLRLYAELRARVLSVITRHYPALLARYQEAYRSGWDAPAAYREAVQRRFQEVAQAYGLTVTDGTQEHPDAPTAHDATQLSLFPQSA